MWNRGNNGNWHLPAPREVGAGSRRNVACSKEKAGLLPAAPAVTGTAIPDSGKNGNRRKSQLRQNRQPASRMPLASHIMRWIAGDPRASARPIRAPAVERAVTTNTRFPAESATAPGTGLLSPRPLWCTRIPAKTATDSQSAPADFVAAGHPGAVSTASSSPAKTATATPPPPPCISVSSVVSSYLLPRRQERLIAEVAAQHARRRGAQPAVQHRRIDRAEVRRELQVTRAVQVGQV